ncbi:hypothetical protein FIA58_013235 [Flavobacterium jejuense]|uniref:Uncharacterized protein n=1 Tax=Flavobacterium jejuense TaxID=1544455 RepID=A0ABX0ISZ8_9FLAO|nr:hypothetical protein [Flavobacterium jejuense]NHN26643.1 hypothetical protein [Flavobacterium jejuense]
MTKFLLEKEMFVNKFCKNNRGENVLIYNAMQSDYELVDYWIKFWN